jgi:hypothetical protein
MPAGRPKGLPKTGGRAKGVLNKITQMKKQLIEEGIKHSMENAESPLEILMNVANGKKDYTDRQIEAAKAAAPYIHARKTEANLNHSGSTTINVVTNVPRSPDDN